MSLWKSISDGNLALMEISSSLETIENTYFLDKPVDFERLNRYVKMGLSKKD